MRFRLHGSTAFALLLAAASAHGGDVSFSTGSPDGLMAMGADPGTQPADDFVLAKQSVLTSATFYILMSVSAQVSSARVDVFRVFPLDSGPASGRVPTRVNSPSDVAYVGSTRMSGTSLNYSTTLIGPSMSVGNSVLLGIHASPNQTTGGEGPVAGAQFALTTTFSPPIVLPAGHYFIALQAMATSGHVFWLSAPKPITSGTPFAVDQQAWITNSSLMPDWLRVGTDIVGGSSPQFNAAFSLSGESIIFRDGFEAH
ncbi:MAG TPA: hypothetical protein VF132_15340 [Rudaea sp.]